MTKQAGLGMRCYVGGSNLSGDVGNISRISGGPAALDLTDITQSAYERAGGLRNGGIGWSSYFNSSRAHPVLAALPRIDQLVTVALGAAVGDATCSCVALQIGYDGTRSNEGAFTFALDAQSDGYGVEWGQQLTAGERTDTAATATGTGLDGTASSAFGCQMYVHLTAFTGTSVTIKLQDSADNATFADLSGATTSAMTTAGWQRIAISNAATVRRYVRVATVGTFSSATFVVTMVRNAIAGQVF